MKQYSALPRLQEYSLCSRVTPAAMSDIGASALPSSVLISADLPCPVPPWSMFKQGVAGNGSYLVKVV
jgi:hypothetical protein